MCDRSANQKIAGSSSYCFPGALADLEPIELPIFKCCYGFRCWYVEVIRRGIIEWGSSKICMTIAFSRVIWAISMLYLFLYGFSTAVCLYRLKLSIKYLSRWCTTFLPFRPSTLAAVFTFVGLIDAREIILLALADFHSFIHLSICKLRKFCSIFWPFIRKFSLLLILVLQNQVRRLINRDSTISTGFIILRVITSSWWVIKRW